MLEQMPNWRYGVVDNETGARLKLEPSPEMNSYMAEFVQEDITVITPITILRQDALRAAMDDEQANPGVMIPAKPLSFEFRRRKMYDINLNTEVTITIVHMVVFLVARYPIARTPILWSDYDKYPPGSLSFEMPSNQQLYGISLKERPVRD